MAAYEEVYKGVKITLTPAGEFKAVIAGKDTTAASLASMKARIDKAGKTTFDPFKIIRVTQEGYSDSVKHIMEEYTVEKIVVSGRRSKYSDQQLSYDCAPKNRERGSRQNMREVVLDTPTNRRIAAELIAFRKETARIRKEREQQDEAIESAFDTRKCPQEPTK